MKTLSVQEIIEATGGKLIHGTLNGAGGISIDSRTIGEGDMFVALKGERYDGHDFLKDALKKGSGAIVSIPPAEPVGGKAIICVENTLKALQDMARFVRTKWDVRVVGVTGTNGKTTTKEMAASVLGTKYKVLKNSGNLNNHIGLPLSLLSLSGEHQAAVLEMGASAPGDIRELCEVASPNFGVITNIGHAHLEGFKDLEAVRRTKLELLDSVRAVAVNADDAFLLEGVRGFGGRVLRYGFHGSQDVYAGDMEFRERGLSFTLHMNGRSARVRLRVTGKFNVYNALAASSVGALFDMDIESVKEGLERFEGVPMRLEIRELLGATVISDVYNANPASMEEALKEMVRLRGERAVAVLGDMLELGAYAEAAHRRLGSWMSGLPVDLFIAVGPLMGLAAEAFSGRSIKAGSAEEARGLLLGECRIGDTILVKGSRGMRLERVINDL